MPKLSYFPISVSHFKRGLLLENLRFLKYKILSSLGVLQLHSLFISLSHQCNARCIHCYEKFNSKKYDEYLSSDLVKNIIDQFYELGGCKVHFCSGEVTLRDDLAELINYARKKKLLTSITSNGILLTKNKIIEYKKAGLNNLIVSIDSADPAKHDKLRGVDGCFKKAIDALSFAKKKRH